MPTTLTKQSHTSLNCQQLSDTCDTSVTSDASDASDTSVSDTSDTSDISNTHCYQYYQLYNSKQCKKNTEIHLSTKIMYIANSNICACLHSTLSLMKSFLARVFQLSDPTTSLHNTIKYLCSTEGCIHARNCQCHCENMQHSCRKRLHRIKATDNLKS